MNTNGTITTGTTLRITNGNFVLARCAACGWMEWCGVVVSGGGGIGGGGDVVLCGGGGGG